MLFRSILDIAMLNKDSVISRYVLTGLDEIQYNIDVMEHYALMEDEDDEKASDLSEIAANARSRKSYIKKWRRNEFKTDVQIDEELMQIAIENNMFDSMSMNAQVQGELGNLETQQQVEKNVQQIETQTKLEEE